MTVTKNSGNIVDTQELTQACSYSSFFVENMNWFPDNGFYKTSPLGETILFALPQRTSSEMQNTSFYTHVQNCGNKLGDY